MKVNEDQIHNFVASTARRLGCRARATINNQTGLDCIVNLIARREDGTFLMKVSGLTEIPDNDATLFELDELGAGLKIASEGREETLFQFALVPKKFAGEPQPYEIEGKLLTQWLLAQDQYVEYYSPETGFACGVNYAIHPLNDKTFGPKSCNIVQAPKVILSPSRNTIFQLIFFSSDVAASRIARVHCVLRKPSGEKVAQWDESAPLHSLLWIDLKDRLRRERVSIEAASAESPFLFFQAFCEDTGFASLSFNFAEGSGTFAYEHSLGPNCYYPAISGVRKGEIISYTEKKEGWLNHV